MEKLSQSIRKRIRSLSSSKGRKDEQAFMTERTKNVLELLESHFVLRWLVALDSWFESHKNLNLPEEKCLVASASDMERMSTLNTPADVIAVFELPVTQCLLKWDKKELYIALDGIQDPGNMGTIIRLADWFGVKTILASRDCVDAFNPKCVISSMGSIARVNVIECDLDTKLREATKQKISIWGTFLDGTNIYEIPEVTAPFGIIVMGNEGNGISDNISEIITERISIPAFPPGKHGAESLNVAMATAITLSEFRRRSISNAF